MTSRFLLTPTLYHKLEGRGMHLICAAPKCLFEDLGVDSEILKFQLNIQRNTDKNEREFRRRILVAGYGECTRCHAKIPFSDFLHDEKTRKAIPKCTACGAPCRITYVQNVVSKHRKSSKYYFHSECYDAMFFGENGEGSDKLFSRRKYKTRYAGAHGDGCVVYLPFDPRKGVCSACGKSKYVMGEDGKPQIKATSLHHWIYAYKAETVRKNPILVIDNTSEFCFACHQIADGLRNIMRLSPERVILVTKLLPKALKEKLAIICNEYLRAVKENG